MATTESHGTIAEPGTQNLPVPSKCTKCFATDAGISCSNSDSLDIKNVQLSPFFLRERI